MFRLPVQKTTEGLDVAIIVAIIGVPLDIGTSNRTGTYLGYNNSLTYNPKATSGSKWQVPLGLTYGRTLLLGNGDGLDLSLGAYDLAKSPDGGSNWQLKFGVSYFFN